VRRLSRGELELPLRWSRLDEIGHLAQDLERMRSDLAGLIAERRQSVEVQRQISDRLTLATRAGGVGIWDYDVVSDKLAWDESMHALYGITPDQFGGDYASWRACVHPDDQEHVHTKIQASLAGEIEFNTEFRVLWPSGAIHTLRALAVVQRDSAGQPLRMLGTNWDISPQKKIEADLHALLQEKTALLLEIHHRVKNNLQVITSLLRLEGGRSKHAATKLVLAQMQGRIRAMALLHETIYRKGSFAAVDLGNYLEEVAQQSLQSLLTVPGSVSLRLELDMVQVGLDQATPCGLLLSELMSNCLKHGFPEGRNGEIHISLKRLDGFDHWRLQVSDTGQGLPDDFERRRENSLGLQMVTGLATQMGGILTIGSGPQAVFTIDFKARADAPIGITD
jgi:PAS domain S-box-containing protein